VKPVRRGKAIVRGLSRTRRRFEIEVTREAEAHLDWLSARDRATLIDAVERRLTYEPTVESRNRKRLRPNPLAPWELRVGHLRVYFDVENEPRRLVTIEAVGTKIRDRLLIGGEEVELK
jgi:mRNA-degrading endonuclease RelE of RelBE toxin-antitoxin system